MSLITFRTGSNIKQYTVHVGNDDRFPQDITSTQATSWAVTTGTSCWITDIIYSSSNCYGARAKCSIKGNDWDILTDNTVGTSSNRDITVYAKKGVTVKYYKNGGAWSSGSDPYTDTVESGSYSGTATPSGRVSRTNYRLLGWSTSSTATTANYGTNEAIGPLGSNLTLYAVWQELPYITLDAGEGRFGTDRYAYFHIDYGGYVYFDRYMPTRDGYTLIGWSATQGATSPTYGPTEYVGPLYGNNYKYYAVWQKATAQITLNGNGGLWDASTGIITVTLDVGDTLLFSKYSSLTREGYKHIGWSTSGSATSAAWGVNGSVTVGATDATYYAVWQKATAEITLNGNGGLWDASTGIITVTMDIGDTLLFSKYASLTRAGYTHLGWSTSSGATSAAWEVNGYVTVGSTDATYYAVWQKKNIALFYWVSDSWTSEETAAKWDAANIKTGQPISNLTATRWNNLKAKIKELAEASGGSYVYDEVKKDDPITAAEFNRVRSKIVGLTGSTNPPAAVTKDKTAITASLFEGTNSLKGALNRAIKYFNGN